MVRKLTPKEIIYDVNFESTNLRNEFNYLLQFDDAYKKIQTALEIDSMGFNVYLIDDFSRDKLENLMDFIQKILDNKPAPKDICYYIDGDKNPKVLYLSNGKGNILKNILDDIKEYYIKITYDFYYKFNDFQKENILDMLQKKRNDLAIRLSQLAEDEGFEIRTNDNGFIFVPLKSEGKAMTEKEYDNLEIDKKEKMLNKVGELKKIAQEAFEELKKEEVIEIEKLKNILKFFFQTETIELKNNYKENLKSEETAVEFLNKICGDIEDNIIENYNTSYEEDTDGINEIINRFDVNVILDNSKNERPRVIFEDDPNSVNLLGNIEYENKGNLYTTDISLIKAGALINANEGCLIIRVNSLINSGMAYFNLMKSLMNGKVNIDYNKGYLELLTINSLRPEAININEKVILIGDYETYDVLFNYDKDFNKIFKIKAEFDNSIKINPYGKEFILEKILNICKKNNITTLSEEAMKEVVKYLSREAEDRDKFYYNENKLTSLLLLSNNKVLKEGKDKIEAEDITIIAYEKDLYEKEIINNYVNRKIFINLNCSLIGAVNALSIIDTGYFSFGKPIRITCLCYKGEGNIIDVQKESNLSGNIHNKSINILKGYINNLLGGYVKLPVDFHLSFEQLYGKIDGDSASVAEIICMISALSKLPINQNIAVTGSINLFGEVQPIGGVNDKIEGFFNICKAIDSIKGKGVLIPKANITDLVLNYEVENEISKGNFNLYTMDNVEDAIDVLIGNEKSKSKNVIFEMNKEIKKYLYGSR